MNNLDRLLKTRERIESQHHHYKNLTNKLMAKELRAIREKSGLCLREVARRAKLSATFVSDCELGRRWPNGELVEVYKTL